MIITKTDRTPYRWDKRYVIADFWGNPGAVQSFNLLDTVMRGIAIISAYYNTKVTITSSFRTKEHNDSLRKQGYRPSEGSLHLKAAAIDFSFSDPAIHKLYGEEMKLKMGSKLYYKLFMEAHISEFIHYSRWNHIGYGGTLSTTYVDETEGLSDYEVQMNQDKVLLKEKPSKDYYEYYFQDSSIKTISEFISQQNSPIRKFNNKDERFLEYSNKNNRNLDNIWSLYTEKQKNKFSKTYKSLSDRLKVEKNVSTKADLELQRSRLRPDYENLDYEINSGTLLYIPKNKANLEVISVTGKNLFLEQQNLTTFMDEKFKKLISDPSYVQTQKVKVRGKAYSVNFIHLSFNCWIYIRAIDKIVNITPFVYNLETSSTPDMGTFSFSVNDITDIEKIKSYGENYYDYFTKIREGNFSLSYFQKYIQQNDIVFIRFEKLDLETKTGVDTNLFINKTDLPNQIYDMIGLVDSNPEMYNAQNNISYSNVSGRDFRKLLVEDGCYFFPFAIMNNSKDFFLNFDSNDKFFKRLWSTGEFKYLFVSLYRSIRDSMGFIFNQLTNVGILPSKNDLFSAYKDKSETYQVSTAKKEYLDSVEQNGVWKIIHMVIDNQLDYRRLNNGELSSPDGSILEMVKRICQEPFVEFYGDTFGDRFVFIARQPPFTKEQIWDYFKNTSYITLKADSISGYNIDFDSTYYTWYQLMPLEGLWGVDKFVASTRMPIVYFEEFASLFGMHKKVIPDSYLISEVVNGEDGGINTDVFRKSLANDMRFVIETNAILPFTRKGTITITGGDRRIKRGTWIYFEPTDEIFYVQSVINSVIITGNTIDRSTTITVERGMKWDCVFMNNDITTDGRCYKKINYFNIVNLDLVVDKLKVKMAGESSKKTKDTSTNSKLIDKDNFDYFFGRKQFDNGRVWNL